MIESRPSPPGRTTRRRIIALGFGLTAGLLAIVPMLTPIPASAASPSGSSAAVVTPLLQFFEFGNSIGTPLICSDAGSVVSIVGAQTGADALTTPLVNELNSLCSTFVSQGNSYLKEGVAESDALSALNPVVNPLLAALANGLNSVGTQYGPSIAPFGPTVAGLGGTVAYFEGS